MAPTFANQFESVNSTSDGRINHEATANLYQTAYATCPENLPGLCKLPKPDAQSNTPTGSTPSEFLHSLESKYHVQLKDTGTFAGQGLLPTARFLNSPAQIVENAAGSSDNSMTSQGAVSLMLAAQRTSSGEEYDLIEQQMREFSAQAKQNGLAPTTVSSFFGSIAKLLDGPSRVPHPERLAQTMLDYALHPDQIVPGLDGTQEMIGLERELFAYRPDVAASMVTSVAQTGKFAGADGMTIDVGKFPGNLIPGKAESRWPTDQFHTSMVTQLLQASMVNDIGQHMTNKQYFDGADSIPLWKQVISGSTISFDGEWRTKDGNVISPFDSEDMSAVAVEARRLMGTDQMIVTDGSAPGTHVSSADQLRDVIQNAAKNHKPLDVGVNWFDIRLQFGGPNRLPSWLNRGMSEMNSWSKGENGTITVDNYDPKTDTVNVYDSDMSRVYRLPVADLYDAVTGA